MIIDAIGMLAGILGVVGFLPQVVKTVRTRHTKDLALGWLIIACISLACWIIYGIARGDEVIFIGNTVLFLLVLVVTVYKVRFG